jgi:hypothetical protein
METTLLSSNETVVIHRATGAFNTPRELAYKAIDSERDYQAKKWGEKPHEIDAFAAYIAEYTNQLIAICGTSDDAEAKLAAVRKVGALAVACMEQNGAPLRAPVA